MSLRANASELRTRMEALRDFQQYLFRAALAQDVSACNLTGTPTQTLTLTLTVPKNRYCLSRLAVPLRPSVSQDGLPL